MQEMYETKDCGQNEYHGEWKKYFIQNDCVYNPMREKACRGVVDHCGYRDQREFETKVSELLMDGDLRSFYQPDAECTPDDDDGFGFAPPLPLLSAYGRPSDNSIGFSGFAPPPLLSANGGFRGGDLTFSSLDVLRYSDPPPVADDDFGDGGAAADSSAAAVSAADSAPTGNRHDNVALPPLLPTNLRRNDDRPSATEFHASSVGVPDAPPAAEPPQPTHTAS